MKIWTYARRKVIQVCLFSFIPLFNLLYLSLCVFDDFSPRFKRNRENLVRPTNKRKMQKQKELDLVICVVVGPGERIGIIDLIESAKCYLKGKYRIIVVDDSGSLNVWRSVRKYSEVVYLRNYRRLGFYKLPQTVRKTFRYALQHYHFKALIKMDPDALFTGPGLIKDILDYYATHPIAGLLGSYRVTCTGTKRDLLHGAKLLKKNWDYWRKTIDKAQSWGYELGAHAQGGAYVLSRLCLQDMEQAGYLINNPGGSRVSEDVTVSLYVKSLGYEIHEFAKSGQPFDIAWRGLPISKEEIVKQEKKAIHSIKYTPEDLQIRDYFRNIRKSYSDRRNAIC